MRPLRVLPLLLSVLLLSSLGLLACKKKEAAPATEAPPKAAAAWSEHLAEHTAGAVSRHARITLRFSHDVTTAAQLNQSAAAVLAIDPAPTGNAIFAGPREIVWQPVEPLKAGQEYRATLKAEGLAGVPADLTPYVFVFRALLPDFELREASLDGEPQHPEQLTLSGRLETADGEEAPRVEKLLVAELDGKPVALSWTHVENDRMHHFSAAGIARTDKAQLLRVSWDGKPLGLAREGVRELAVPALGVFTVLDAAVLTEGRQTIRVRFTDTLEKAQKLDALVSLSQGGKTVQIDGSDLLIYPTEHLAGEVTVAVEAALKNTRGKKLGQKFEKTLTFPNERPQVRFTGRGSILPAGPALSIPFEAMNARSVRITAFQIYENDVGQFLQGNTLAGDSELPRVGRYLWRKTVTLPTGQPDRWNRHALDATELLQAHPGALFRLSLSITRADSSYACPGEVPAASDEPLANYEDLDLTQASGWDGIEQYYEGEGGGNENWTERDNPCNDAYFRYNEGVKAERNFLASNLGLVAKRGADGKVHVAASAIDSATPLAGVALDIRNFQNQSIARAETGSDGLVSFDVKGVPFYLVAKKGGEIGYLKMSKGTALANSHFDVGGEAVEGGLKGMVYGERGVWRPGDDIHLTFLLQDDSGKLPADHPVTMQLFNPANQLVQSLTSKTPVDGFYTFTLKTADDAPTGLWRAKALVGGREFGKNLPIETVMPNRLKMALAFDKPLRAADMPVSGTLDAQWLHGALASGLKADVAVKLLSKPLAFTSFKDFTFEDPTRKFKGEPATLFEGKLDAKGQARFSATIESGGEAPAMLEADFTTRVFEEGGAFSTAHSSEPFHPYQRYVGLRLPKGDAIRGMLLTDQKHTVELAVLDAEGKGVSADAIHVSVHKIEWKWWWEKDGATTNADFASGQNLALVAEGDVPVKDGRGSWPFEIKYPDWGRYLVRACDPEGGHCTGRIFYADWPGWAGRAEEQTGPGANALYFFADKPEYRVGETAVVQLPDATAGRALLSIETGSKLIEQRWLELAAGKTRVEIPITAAMSPNAYVAITLIQPHRAIGATADEKSKGKDNDRPIRLYGIIPLKVTDPATVLAPEIKAPEVWRPNGTVEFQVSEKAGREMTYTVAIVDEGLLGLTSFKTPDPHATFYQREALGVSTWDVYDDVAGAYGAAIERLLSLGGDEGGVNKEAQEQKRFPPVVRVLGPFRLKSKEFARHAIELPQYSGAVRIMVVAGRAKAYGRAEKSVIVREPLSVLATAPRVLGPDEEMRLPVSAFAFEPAVKSVKLTLEADPKSFETVGPATASLGFDAPGEKSAFFTLKAKRRIGSGRISVKAESGSHRSTTVIDLPVLPRNPAIAVETQRVLQVGESWSENFTALGIAGTNTAALTLSAVPPFGLERRLDMLIHYPHGCAEQLTSAAFPQLYLDRLLTLEPKRQKDVQTNVEAAINRLRVYLAPTGGFTYWPGAGVNHWADNYAGHFLAEAKARGYFVPAEMWDAWLARQRKAAADGNRSEDAEVRAYRLYTLALADKPDVGAMNRLAEEDLKSNVARWQLAAAYAQIGLPKVAREVLAKNGGSLVPAKDGLPGPNFRSELRDRAILLDVLTRVGDAKAAEVEAVKIAAQMASEEWLSTQSAAWGLSALARHYGADQSAGFRYGLALNGGAAKTAESAKPVLSQPLPELAEGGALTLGNRSERLLTASVLRRGSPAAGEEKAMAQGLALDVRYTTLKGEALDETKLKQGTDFLARVTVANQSGNTLADLALTQVFPSGWQIHNPRFTAGEATPPGLDYQDLRDDRVMSYFGLKSGESRTFEVLLNASYRGRYYLPAVSAEAMYDVRQRAHTAGRWVEVGD